MIPRLPSECCKLKSTLWKVRRMRTNKHIHALVLAVFSLTPALLMATGSFLALFPSEVAAYGCGCGGGGSGGDGSGGDGSGGDGSGGDGSGGDGSGGDGSGGDGSGGDGSGGDGSGGDGSGGDGSGGDGSGGDGSGGDGSGGDGSGGDGSGGDGSGGDGSGGDGSGGDGSGGNGSGGDGSDGGGSGGDDSDDDGSDGTGSGGDDPDQTGGQGDSSSSFDREGEGRNGSGVLDTGNRNGSAGGLTALFGGAAAGAAPGTVVTAPGSGNPEVVVVGPEAQVDEAIAALEGVGGRYLRARVLGSLGLRLLVFEYPRGRALAIAQDALRDGAPGMTVSFHAIYRYSQARPRTYAAQLVAGGSSTGCRLPRSVRIGMIDGPVDGRHPALTDASLTTVSLLRESERAAQDDHGTAIAALMIGEDASGILSGFARGAQVFSVAIFSSRWGRERADVERIAAALDYLLARNVRLINMSFSGPDNAVLRIVLDAAAAGGAIMIAAVGNDGSADGALPAASGSVIAVTAVDSRMRRYREANTGPHVEFAAPGVDVFAAKSRRGGYVSGTSFAAPIVTSVAAGLVARGTRALSGIRRQMRNTSYDLGPPGRDPEFGWGLARVANCQP